MRVILSTQEVCSGGVVYFSRFVVTLALSVLAFAFGLGKFALNWDLVMKTDLIKDCVETLKALRSQKHEELDVRTAAELDEVIRLLESCLKDGGEVDAELQYRALVAVDKCLSAATNIAQLIQLFFGDR